jgi:hypothetical protein
MENNTDPVRHPAGSPRRVRHLLLEVSGLAAVIELFDTAVVELFDDEPTDEPAPTAA